MSSQSKVSKRKPHVFYEATAVWQSRLKSTSEDSYMQLFSSENIEYHMGIKPLGNVKLKFLEDHIECKSTSLFGSKLPRSEIAYSQIDRCVSAAEPAHIICMAVVENESDIICEIFKIKNAQQVNEIQDLVQKARQHPQYKLVDPNSAYLSGSMVSLNENESMTNGGSLSKSKNNLHKSYEDMTMSEMVETNKTSSTLPKRQIDSYRPVLPMEAPYQKKKQIGSIEEPYIKPEKDYNQRSSAPTSADFSEASKPTTDVTYISDTKFQKLKTWHPQDVETLKRDLLKNVDDSSTWSVEVNCIENHPKFGNRISDNGSIYMFIAHMTPENRNYSMCSSSNVSLHSLNDESANIKAN